MRDFTPSLNWQLDQKVCLVCPRAIVYNTRDGIKWLWLDLLCSVVNSGLRPYAETSPRDGNLRSQLKGRTLNQQSPKQLSLIRKQICETTSFLLLENCDCELSGRFWRHVTVHVTCEFPAMSVSLAFFPQVTSLVFWTSRTAVISLKCSPPKLFLNTASFKGRKV